MPTFDPAAVAQLLLADHDDRRAQALFIAMVHHTPVIGIAVAALGARAAMSPSSMNADAFAASFTRLQPAFAPSATVEIGMSDNGVVEAGTEGGGNADANWDDVIAALVKGVETPIDAGLAHSLADQLAKDTGEKWRIVSSTALH